MTIQITELRQALERAGGKFDHKLVFSDSEVSRGISDGGKAPRKRLL